MSSASQADVQESSPVVPEENNHQESTPTKDAPVEPTNEVVPSEQRRKKLVRKNAGPLPIKYGLWFGGHVSSIVFGIVAIVWQALLLNNCYYLKSISYRLSLMGAVVALVVTMTRRFGLSNRPRFSLMLVQKNFQYALLLTVWIFTFPSIFKILPTVLVSILQLAENKQVSAVLKLGDTFGTIIAFNEIILLFYLFLRTVVMLKTSGYQFMLMMTLLWLRVMFDRKTAEMFAYVVDLLDGKVSSTKNKKVKRAWNKFRAFLKEKTKV